jgi:hypothetical protein
MRYRGCAVGVDNAVSTSKDKGEEKVKWIGAIFPEGDRVGWKRN